MGRESDKHTDNDEESRKLTRALPVFVPLIGLIAATLNFEFAIAATCSSHWDAVWVFATFCIANIAIMFAPRWWKKVNSRRASAILLLVIFAGWVANCFLGWRYAIAQWVL